MNKSFLGLHAWGNVVPFCSAFNNERQQKSCQEFIISNAGSNAAERTNRIHEFVASKNYDPTLNLNDFAGNLYEDVGQVAMTLINIRYKQAQDGIKKLLV
jgi:hypothetical protein